MLSDEYLSMLHVDTPEELFAKVLGFVHRLGLPLMSAMTVVDRVGAPPAFRSIHNLPPGYRPLYNDMGLAKVHPVMQHCKRSSVPLVWSRSTFAKSNALDVWESQAAHGLSCGIALALHLPNGRHFCVGASGDQALPANATELSRMVADLHLFAVCAQDAAMRLLADAPAEERAPRPALTRREAECLQWTMEGKTAWEIGQILGISEYTAVRHINNAMHKLGAVNKHQAVLRALRLNLIH
jgi:DNA-binding CsgD family transcriptional regulator